LYSYSLYFHNGTWIFFSIIYIYIYINIYSSHPDWRLTTVIHNKHRWLIFSELSIVVFNINRYQRNIFGLNFFKFISRLQKINEVFMKYSERSSWIEPDQAGSNNFFYTHMYTYFRIFCFALFCLYKEMWTNVNKISWNLIKNNQKQHNIIWYN